MSKEERKLSKKELERKENYEKLCVKMEEEGYKRKELIVGVVAANVLAIVITFPFIAIFAWIANMAGVFEKEVNTTPIVTLMIFVVAIVLIVVHEAIHGLVWGAFAKSHFKSIDFGVIWSMMTPYCTCSEPLKRWQYIWGGLMPTLVLGFLLGIIAILIKQPIVFLVAELMILGGGGDFLIVAKMLLFRPKSKQVVYYDHPYECGLVAFVKEDEKV